MSINKRLIKSNEGGSIPLSFNTITWTGNGTVTRNFGGLGFQPDFVWMKVLNTPESHALCNSVVGAGKKLLSDTNSTEQTIAGVVSSFNSDGFSYSTTYNDGGVFNYLNWSSIAWCWRAAGYANTFNVLENDSTTSSATAAGAGITAGSNTNNWSVSANRDSGFSVVTYRGNSTNATIGHGLNSAPSMIILKNRTRADNWVVYHSSLGPTKYWNFNTDADVNTYSFWNNTNPTSSVFSVSSNIDVNNSSHDYVAYCFAEIEGFSKFGSYTGASGLSIDFGFEPAFVLIKRVVGDNDSVMYDNKRGAAPLVSRYRLIPNGTSAEDRSSARYISFTSNGISFPNSDGKVNNTGSQYVYMAFANQF